MEMLFALFGGLAMFLYGMDRMSRALQRAAGDAMKRLLARLTATPLMGVLTGLAVTAVLQSSSAATVMVIGFVSAGLLELPRAVAVIYGINIGTTMTAQLIAFDVQTLVYPVLFLGFLLDFAARRPRWQAVGEAVFSFGLLFEGIDILGRALQPLAGQAVFLDWMTRVKESPLLGILLGLSMTMVVQSSSATIALLQNLARQAGPDGIHSVLGLAGAVPVLLGDNIGTTVTALLACIGQGKNAARAALAHSCFNLSGSLLAAVLLSGCITLLALWCQPNALRTVLAHFKAQPLLIVLNAMPIGLLVLALTPFGIANMWEAVFADVGVMVIAILNASRALQAGKKSFRIQGEP